MLLADDDSDDRYFIKQAIISSGFRIKLIEAENGAELIALLSRSTLAVSLIILDMNMPKMNGLETVSEIKSMHRIASVPVVMISTSPSQDLLDKAYKAGVQSFIPKPDTFEEFIDLITFLNKQFLS